MLSVGGAYGIIIGCTAIGIVYGVLNYFRVRKVDLIPFGTHGNGVETPLSGGGEELDKEKVDTMLQIGEYISNVNSLLLCSF